MPRGNGIITNRLTIYLIKPKYQQLEDIIDSATEPRQVGDVGQFVFEASHPEPPAWITSFFGDALGENLGIVASSAKGIFLVPIRSRNTTINFIVSFGLGRHLLKEGVIEERFGLKVVLNSVGQESFRSIDKTTLGSVPKHSREQMSRDVAPADFGIDIEQDLVSSVTARSNDSRFGKIISGKDALHVSVPVNKSNISEFLAYCHERYRSNAYKQNFDWIDQIAEVRNGAIEDELNARLVQRINQNALDKIWMAVPEVVDWATLSGFRHIRAKRAELQDDLHIEQYLESFPGRQISLENLKNDHIFAISAESGEQLFRWTAFLCTYAEINLRSKVHILNNGKWYEIARGFANEVQRDFIGTPDCDIELPDYTAGSELEYNTLAAGSLGAGACCMDQDLIASMEEVTAVLSFATY